MTIYFKNIFGRRICYTQAIDEIMYNEWFDKFDYVECCAVFRRDGVLLEIVLRNSDIDEWQIDGGMV